MTGQVINFPRRAEALPPKAPRFDPGNPAHQRAWEAIFEFGRASLYSNRAPSED